MTSYRICTCSALKEKNNRGFEHTMHRYHIKCLVCGLTENAKNPSSQQIRFYGLPQNKNKRRLWLISINRSDLLNKKISPDLQICEQHFMSHMIVPNTSRLKLTTTALPSPIIIKTEIETQEIEFQEIETELTYQDNENTWQPLGSSNTEVVRYTVLEGAASGLTTTNIDLKNLLVEEATSQLEAATVKVKKLEKEVTKLKNEVKYYKGKDFFLEKCKDMLSPSLASLVENEVSGWRFSAQLEKFCSGLYSISPTAYSFVSHIINLPKRSIVRTYCNKRKRRPSGPVVKDTMPRGN